MPSNYNMIKEFLKRSQYNYDEEQIDITYRCLETAFFGARPLPYRPTLEDFTEYSSAAYPNHVLWYKCYEHPNICNIILYLIVERLQLKDIEATKREIHALCFQAQERVKSGQAHDETHAANYVLKIFQSGAWNEPYDFVFEFPEYKRKLINLNEVKKEKK